MPIRILRKYLDECKVKYVVLSHSSAYTAQEIAQSAHISGKEIAKTVIVKIDGILAMVVLPASFKIDFELLKLSIKTQDVTLAAEAEFVHMFPDCETGAMPPFGNLYGIDVLAANRLEEHEMITFNAGNHRELIRMKFTDFKRIVDPFMIDMTFESVYF